MVTAAPQADIQMILKAANIYMQIAYPSGNIPAAVQNRLNYLERPDEQPNSSSGNLWEATDCGGKRSFALRLGQPLYPHMKLVIEQCPTEGVLFRADAHDTHLHAPEGSPDYAPLAALRATNKQLTETIEAAWVQAGLPTFRDYLRQQLAKRKNRPTA